MTESDATAAFTEVSPRREDYWRAVVLFGRNVASYKFALAKSLLELSGRDSDLVTLEELAEPFSRHVCEHLRGADRQGTSRSSTFLAACRAKGSDESVAYRLRWMRRRSSLASQTRRTRSGSDKKGSDRVMTGRRMCGQ